MARKLGFVILLVLVSLSAISCSKDGGVPKQAEKSLAPSFVLNDTGGRKVSLADYHGQVVVLDFFATWCEPCRMLAPELKTFYERYKNRGVAVIAISMDEGADAVKMVTAYKNAFGLTYPVVIDDGQARKQYDVFSLPTTVIIDRDGRVRSKHLGITADYTKHLESEVAPLLNKQSTAEGTSPKSPSGR